MNEQAAGLCATQVPALPRLAAPLVLLTGGKGGVGKTTIAANLSVHLARAGVRVLLVDLDLGLANLNVLLRLSPTLTLEDWLEGRKDIAACVVPGPGGVAVLPAGSGTADMARGDASRRARLFDGLAELSADYDLVIGDAAAGIGPDVLAFGCAADRVLAVTTPEPPALTDAYGVVKALATRSGELGVDVPTPDLVVNLARGAEEASEVARKLGAVCERFLSRSPRLAGWLPRGAEVLRSVTGQRPFVLAEPRSLAAQCAGQLADRLWRSFPGGSRR